MTSRPLVGVRVADFSRILAGPFCTMVLGDLGADVVKVEHPDGGDDTHAWGPPFRALARTHPAIVYCSIPGYSDEGSHDRPAYDLTMQAASGFMSITGHAGSPPVRVGAAVLDVIAGLHAATGILAALRVREETGRGTRVSVSLFDASVAALVNQAANHLIGEWSPGDTAVPTPTSFPTRPSRPATARWCSPRATTGCSA